MHQRLLPNNGRKDAMDKYKTSFEVLTTFGLGFFIHGFYLLNPNKHNDNFIFSENSSVRSFHDFS